MRLNYVHNLKMGVPILSHYGLQDTVRNYDGFYWTAPYLWLVYLNLGNVKKNWVFIIYSWTKKNFFSEIPLELWTELRRFLWFQRHFLVIHSLISKQKCSTITATGLGIRKCPSFTPCKLENIRNGNSFSNTVKYCKNDIFPTFLGLAPTKIAALTWNLAWTICSDCIPNFETPGYQEVKFYAVNML